MKFIILYTFVQNIIRRASFCHCR